MPVVRPRKAGQRKESRGGQKLSLEQKLAKMVIGDVWLRDEDGTRYYVNATVANGKKYVRIRIDIPGSEPLTLLLEPELGIKLANAIFRAAFNAQVLTVGEIQMLWQQLRGQFKQKGAAKKYTKKENAQEESGQGEETDIPDFGFA